ncbi:uncharacterized protein CTRU02_201606 [Colletotrichum truncatum]|uniref:Uncharacterized protein n=1 Tax=Colletotrichum truncatum TaxID=5467 RepID=A0ACC3ZHZ8_COLTU
MGGKVWSREEERVYWRVIIPQSQRRAGPGPLQTKSWEDLAMLMQSRMRADAKRTYTGLGLFEHYFQNVEKGRVSPNATKYVREHKEALDRAAQGDEETDIEDNEIHENATASEYDQRQDNFVTHTGETTEEEPEEILDSITVGDYENKENHPAPPTREPLSPLREWDPLPSSSPAPVAHMNVDSTAHLGITVNVPRRGLNYQHPISTERSTVTNKEIKEPAFGYEYQPQPHNYRYGRPQGVMGHRRNPSVRNFPVPPHLLGKPEHHGYGSRYFCLPTPDNRFLPPQSQYYDGHAADQTQSRPPQFTSNQDMNFTAPREQYSPSVSASIPGTPHPSPSSDFNFTSGNDQSQHQYTTSATFNMSQSVLSNNVNPNSYTDNGRQHHSHHVAPSNKRSYESFKDDDDLSEHQYYSRPLQSVPGISQSGHRTELTGLCAGRQDLRYRNTSIASSSTSQPAQYGGQYGNQVPQFSDQNPGRPVYATSTAYVNHSQADDLYRGPIPKVIAQPESVGVQQNLENRRWYMTTIGAAEKTEETSVSRPDGDFEIFEMSSSPSLRPTPDHAPIEREQ